MNPTVLRGLVLVVLLGLPGPVARAAFEAYNACGPAKELPATATNYKLGETGPLTDFATGVRLKATVAVKGRGAEPATGPRALPGAETDAGAVFGGKAGAAVAPVHYGEAGWSVDVEFAGLDPKATYTLAVTANRGAGAGMANRWTKWTLTGAAASEPASSAGVSNLSAEAVAFCTGDNAAGRIARWTHIRCGEAGTLALRAENHPFGGETVKSYGPAVILLKEETGEPPSGPRVAAAAPKTSAAAPSGGVAGKLARAVLAEPGPQGLTKDEPTNPALPGDFAIVALPDTQMYTAQLRDGTPEMFAAQTGWIVSNRIARNIVYVTMEGDISNDGNKTAKQWQHATNALARLEDPSLTGLPQGLPYGTVVGNHDTHHGGTASYNQYFGTNRFAGRSYYGGHYGADNDSHYDLFSAGGRDYIVLALTMAAGSDSNLMAWANGVLTSNAHRRAIVVTHSLLNPAPCTEPAPWTPEGPAIFGALSGNTNLFLMLCGHRHGEGRRHEVLEGGHAIDVVLADYQSYRNGGDGFLRLLEFSPSNRCIRVKTYSPWTGEWATGENSHFKLDDPP